MGEQLKIIRIDETFRGEPAQEKRRRLDALQLSASHHAQAFAMTLEMVQLLRRNFAGDRFEKRSKIQHQFHFFLYVGVRRLSREKSAFPAFDLMNCFV